MTKILEYFVIIGLDPIILPDLTEKSATLGKIAVSSTAMTKVFKV